MRSFAIIASILFCVHAFSSGEEGLIVRLATESERLPFYLATIDQAKSSLEKGYIAALEKILRFDLENNGKTAPLEVNASLEKLAKSDPLNENLWREWNVSYFVRGEVEGKSLKLKLYSVKGNWVKEIGPILISANVAQDRHKMHEVADTIHEALFGVKGIAATRILYTVKKSSIGSKDDWSSDIWEVDYDGGNPREVLSGAGYCVTPQYVPPKPGNQVGSFFFVSYKTGQPKIYTATLDGKNVQRLTTLRGNQLMPTLSYKRDKIAFISDVTGNPDLFVQDFSSEAGVLGKPQQLFTAPLATQGTPSFSPDGKKIAFVSNKDGSPRIYVIDVPLLAESASGLKATLVTKFRRGCTAPAWSPDAKKIAYCARVDGVRQIFLYNFTTGQEEALTTGSGDKENATWAPNSLHLVYNRTVGTACDLYMLNINQKKPIRLTSGPGEKRFPHWQPK